MKLIEIDRSYQTNGPAPLYYQYPSQTSEQPAYLSMDEEGRVSVDWDGAIGATPIDVWHRLILRWSLDTALSVHGIDEMLEQLSPYLTQLHNEHTVEWDGNNLVGRLTEEGAKLYDSIEYMIEHGYYEELEIWDAEEYVRVEWALTVQDYGDCDNKDRYISELISVAQSDGITLVNVDRLREKLDEEINE